MRKPQAGRCGVCGRAVVVPRYPKVIAVAASWHRSDRVWVDGHCYHWDEETCWWTVRMVRCDQHMEPDDPRYTVEMHSE